MTVRRSSRKARRSARAMASCSRNSRSMRSKGSNRSPVGSRIIATDDRDTKQRFKERLVIIDDDSFSHFVQHATEVTARIALHYETKPVKRGALFYEEYLPPETVLYSVVLAERSRSNSRKMTAAEVLDTLTSLGLRTVQIGAGETIGKGLCALRFARPN